MNPNNYKIHDYGTRKNEWMVPLKRVPITYEKGIQSGVFNELQRLERDILIDRYEQPRLSLTKTATKRGLSISYVSTIENKALDKMSLRLRQSFPLGEDFMIGVPLEPEGFNQ